MVPTSNACTYNPGEAYKNEKNIAKVTYEENNKEHKVQEHIYYISMRTCRQEWSTKNMKHNNMIRLINKKNNIHYKFYKKIVI